MTEHYRLALLRVLGGLFVMAGMTADNSVVEKLPRHVRNAILRVLRPAESATRRLAAVKARELETVDYTAPAKRKRSVPSGKKRGPRAPQFCLIDPRKDLPELHPHRHQKKRKPRSQPSTEPQIQVRIAGFDGQPDFIWSEPKSLPMPNDELNAGAICRRMVALKLALEDLPKQAKRYVREVAKRKAAPSGIKSIPPLRFGWPPGFRKRRIHEIDEILWECHCLERRPPDTS